MQSITQSKAEQQSIHSYKDLVVWRKSRMLNKMSTSLLNNDNVLKS